MSHSWLELVKLRFWLCCLVTALLATPALAAPWVRGFVATHYEPAWYFGGNENFQKAGTFSPGSDCPGGTQPNLDYDALLKTSWRTAADIEAINHPANRPLRIIPYVQQYGLTFRGFRDGIDVYINPFSAPDPGIQPVTGSIAEGFDLDNNARTGGFTSPLGEKGIDNTYYRIFGCYSSFRGAPYHAALSTRANGQMLAGLYTMVVRVSGNKDPLNDDDAVVEIGYSPDRIAEGPNDVFLPDYSFRIVQNAEYSKVKAIVKNGVIETVSTPRLHAPRFSWYPDHYGDADFHAGRLRLAPNADGSYSGLIGGYRDWRDIYAEDNFAQSGGLQEQREHQNSIGLYYALKRYADGMPDGTGRNTGISVSYRFRAQQSFVVDPAKPYLVQPFDLAKSGVVTRIVSLPNGVDVPLYQATREAFYKAIITRKVQPIPPGSTEAAHAFIERDPDGTWRLIDHGDGAMPDKPVTPKPAPGNRQVRGGAPASVAVNTAR